MKNSFFSKEPAKNCQVNVKPNARLEGLSFLKNFLGKNVFPILREIFILICLEL